ncbi:NADH:ubiquinone reductase (Na(+)-transporting) subunit F [Paracoccus sp. (in: a-proteobacteria)]|uniref:NADH:ubiquinone reductase (Na(+)-transporting) subunit F n=1 Tax=Paracoccus sp. TaxID=267 RepID=UPI0026E04257|nr:NADH:ubiquinone reductase (Na(+)-transporting) subunit F [Paracoccus sp. (in: a-proteobacteria)]MDO5647085.1 NADH:ubiquinone reductase (Na(+)-transporting) subunit F [Paracoccus sp. (in: a-proteobacteria)]
MIEIVLGFAVLVTLVMALTLGLLAARRRLIPQGAVTVTVNGSTELPAARGDKLLSVLHNGGLPIPAACGGSGTCGLCRVTASGPGAGQAQATEKGILSAAERRAGVRLACQMTLRGPVDVQVAGDVLAADSFACRVVSNDMLAPLIRELVLELPQGQRFDFRAGGFAQLTAPAYRLDFADFDIPPEYRTAWDESGWAAIRAHSAVPVSRAYSIASRPQDAGRIVFNIRLAVPPAGEETTIPPGLVSSWLFSLTPGDQVQVAGPFGEFHVQPTEREMIFIGGGVGMAPLRAMIHEQIGQGTGRRMRYFYGARTAGDLFYNDEFDAIAAEHPNFEWVAALTDPAPGDRWTGQTGFIHETVRDALRRHPAPEDCEYYLCGPPVMISAVLATLARLGVEPQSIFNDDFGA